MILRPTRISSTSGSLIDQKWSSDCSRLISSGQLLYDLTYKRYSHSKNYVEFTYRLNNSECHDHFRQLAANNDWGDLLDNKDVDNLYNQFSVELNNLFNAAYPVKTVKKKVIDVSKPYIDSALLKIIKEKQN